MKRYFLGVLAFFTIACCLTLQLSATANATTSETVASDDTDRFGFGFTNGVYVSNGGLVSSLATSWKAGILGGFGTQMFLGTNNGTKVWTGSRFLYTSHIKSQGKFYVGWGVNYPISQIETDTEEQTLSDTWFEAFVGFEYFSSSLRDLGYSVEVGVNPSDDLGVRLSFGYHAYF